MLDRVSQPDGEALGAVIGGDGGGTDGREGQPVAQNHASSARKVDSKGMAEDLRVFKGGRWHGIKNESVHRW